MSHSLVCFVTHLDSPQVRVGLAKLVADLSGVHDVVALLSMRDPMQVDAETIAYRPHLDHRPEFPERSELNTDNVDLLLLHAAIARPGYDHYWAVEYDVRFSGDWSVFFSAFEGCTADLLGTTLLPHDMQPSWPHWHSLRGPSPVPMESKLRGFFPIYRLSAAAIAELESAYRAGWGGHYELTMPTLLHKAGMRIEDIGGAGPFTPPERHERFYTNTPGAKGLSPGSFVYRPIRQAPGERADTLWHPVRAAGEPTWRYPGLMRRLLKRARWHR